MDTEHQQTIRLFVGCAAGFDAESQAVLEYTARKLSSSPIDIVWMYQAKHGFWSSWNTKGWRTPFTGFRWGVPIFCGFQGRAIYMDSDFILRADIAELWTQPIPGAILIRRPNGKLPTSSMLMDCDRLKGHIPLNICDQEDQDGQMRRHFAEHLDVLSKFDGDWNCTDLRGYEYISDPRIKAIHYSRIETQPHLKWAIPRLRTLGLEHWYKGKVYEHGRKDLIELFDFTLTEALAAGYTLDRYETGITQLKRRDFKYKVH
jgi:hypothetical protein